MRRAVLLVPKHPIRNVGINVHNCGRCSRAQEIMWLSHIFARKVEKLVCWRCAPRAFAVMPSLTSLQMYSCNQSRSSTSFGLFMLER